VKFKMCVHCAVALSRQLFCVVMLA